MEDVKLLESQFYDLPQTLEQIVANLTLQYFKNIATTVTINTPRSEQNMNVEYEYGNQVINNTFSKATDFENE